MNGIENISEELFGEKSDKFPSLPLSEEDLRTLAEEIGKIIVRILVDEGLLSRN